MALVNPRETSTSRNFAVHPSVLLRIYPQIPPNPFLAPYLSLSLSPDHASRLNSINIVFLLSLLSPSAKPSAPRIPTIGSPRLAFFPLRVRTIDSSLRPCVHDNFDPEGSHLSIHDLIQSTKSSSRGRRSAGTRRTCGGLEDPSCCPSWTRQPIIWIPSWMETM